jgi:hypothetical protein
MNPKKVYNLNMPFTFRAAHVFSIIAVKLFVPRAGEGKQKVLR